ncbi:MAG: germination protein YpeB [Clostridia bacterium]|nr:germination protein YpeB [Clostridia bacterium]MBQ9714769.1 germination protein YpeB [Clostridia bacterium]
MKKQDQEIATNLSSGAEKVERVEKEVKKEKSAGGKTAAKKVSVKVEKEKDAAKARVNAALDKKKAAEKRKVAQAKAAAERKAARAERREKRKAIWEEEKRKRAHEKAARNQERERRRKARIEARRQRAEESGKRQRSGNGGWIAAVAVLGATTLALGSAVTASAVEMKRSNEAAMTAYRGTMYELTGIMEHVDGDLDRVRISSSPAQQSRILTDLLVQARLAEVDLEKLPLAAESERGITSFINRTAHTCERMLAKLRQGEELSEQDFETLERLYKANHSIRMELDKVLAEMTDKDLTEFIKKGTGGIADAIGRIEKTTLEENRADMERGMEKAKEKMKEWGKKAEKAVCSPDKMPHIESARAEELCLRYFSDYNITEYQCVGETVTEGYAAYNVQGYDDKGTLLFAEISQKDGALIRFDYYEDCMNETFDLQNAERIAEDFLEKLGYDDMEVVMFRENGTMTDFTFVYEDDDVAYYPDEIRVKICRSRGVVTGMDAVKYLKNHKDREEPNVKLSLAQAREQLHEKLTVESSRLAVVNTKRGEIPAYEFLCSYENENYFVYLDAMTGEEISIVNAKTVY